MTQENDNPAGEDPQNFASAAPAPEGSHSPAEDAIEAAVDGAEDFFAHEADPAAAKGKNQDLVCSFFLYNDVGNAKRLIARFGNELMYVKDHGWYGWTGTHWSLDEGQQIAEKYAHKTAAAIFHEVAAIERAPAAAHDKDGKLKQQRVRAHKAFAVRSGNSQKLASMLIVAAPYLTRKVEELDANPYLFNCKNGTVDLGNIGDGIRRHNRADLITRCANANYYPEAAKRPETFLKFLETILPEETLRHFVHKYFGYCLTGLNSEQCLVLLQGGGSNGKSTLMDLMKFIFGDYSKIIPIDSLLYQERASGAQASPDIARLPGARLVMASEPEVGARLSESRIKSFTGSEEISVRHLNRGFFDFKPQFKICLAFNNKPSVRGQDDGIWRRLLLVPFRVQIPLEQRDHSLQEKLRGEADAILSWLITGCEFWLEQRLTPPESVIEATSEYRIENDPVGQFLESATKRANASITVRASTLFEAYEYWCEQNGASPLTQTAFGKRMLEKGYEKMKSSTILWRGLYIVDEYDPDKRKEQSNVKNG